MNSFIDLSGKIGFSPLGFITNILRPLESKTSLSIEEIFGSTKHNSKTVRFIFNGKEFEFQLKQLKEFLHASYFVLSTYKEFGEKYELSMGDSPDIVMVNEAGCIPVEIYEAFDFEGEVTAEQVPEIVKRLHRAKGMKRYADGTRLLIANRYSGEFNVSEFAREIAKYHWTYSQIILSLYRAAGDDYTFFNVTPNLHPQLLERHAMTFSLSVDKKHIF